MTIRVTFQSLSLRHDIAATVIAIVSLSHLCVFFFSNLLLSNKYDNYALVITRVSTGIL